MPRTRDEMAALAAEELRDGHVVNLGIGIPTLVANHVADDLTIWLHSENGLWGWALSLMKAKKTPRPTPGKQTVTVAPEAALSIAQPALP